MSKNKRCYIVSPCGTSSLTNGLDAADRKLLFCYANAKSKDEIPAADLQSLGAIIQAKEEQFTNFSIEEAKDASAELNGILSLYEGRITQEAKQNHHWLLGTDTYLGSEAARLVGAWLQKQGLSVETERVPDLQTRDLLSFQSALSDLVKKFSEELPGWQDKGYRVVFNLTGGFKAVQGFLQSIAHFYADETVYIFEQSKQLLRIPSLPVFLEPAKEIEENLNIFRRLALGLSLDEEDAQTARAKISGTLLLALDKELALSPWGDVLWDQSKRAIYKKQLWPAPSPKIKYSSSFEDSCDRLSSDRYLLLNLRMDELARHLERKEHERSLASLDFKKLKGDPKPPSTHEFDAWSDQDAKRVFGHFEEEVFVLDSLDKGLH